MEEAYQLLSKIYETLNNDPELKSYVNGIFLQAQRPIGKTNPVLLIFIRDYIESTATNALSDVFIDFVVRSNSPDGDGTEMSKIFRRTDKLLNGVYFKTASGGGKLSRAGLQVSFGLFDESMKDNFKRWRYRVRMKKSNQ